jgi:hypothetical protein
MLLTVSGHRPAYWIAGVSMSGGVDLYVATTYKQQAQVTASQICCCKNFQRILSVMSAHRALGRNQRTGLVQIASVPKPSASAGFWVCSVV